VGATTICRRGSPLGFTGGPTRSTTSASMTAFPHALNMLTGSPRPTGGQYVNPVNLFDTGTLQYRVPGRVIALVADIPDVTLLLEELADMQFASRFPLQRISRCQLGR
jgi:hypothetical protein